MRTRNVLDGKTPTVSWFQGKKSYVGSKEAIKVIIETRLRTIYKEVWSDPDTQKEVGIPYFQNNDKEEYDLLIKSEINDVEGVKEVIELKSKVVNHKYYAHIIVLTNLGEVAIEL